MRNILGLHFDVTALELVDLGSHKLHFLHLGVDCLMHQFCIFLSTNRTKEKRNADQRRDCVDGTEQLEAASSTCRQQEIATPAYPAISRQCGAGFVWAHSR